MIEITSINNDLIKDTVKLQQKKYRQQSEKFLLEGAKSVQEAIKFGVKIDKIFVLKEKQNFYNFNSDNIILTNQNVLKKISTTDSSPEVVAVAFQPYNDVQKLKNARKVLLLENIADAGNLGTIIRTAAAFNIDSIVIYGDSVDLYNTKTVRASVGNLWKLNIVKLNTVNELNEYFSNFDRVATLPKNNNSILLKDWIPNNKTLVMFGSEANGLSDELKEFATVNLTIEMNSSVESLNLAISASIIMYKLGLK